ncbi:MAG: hypothetical protein AAB515_03850 [Patescibacteria group bacterium]
MSSIEKLLIFDATRSRTTTHVFIGHPSPAEERSLGKLGFVAEIAGSDRIFQELLSRLQEFVKTAYYTSPEAHADVAFEHTIQATNRYLSELVGDFGAGWVDRFSMVLFTFRDGEVHFADVGQLVGFLFHEKQVVELLAGRQRTSRVNPLKMFTSIATGTIKGQDAIVFGTANLLDYFSVDKLRRTVVEMPLGGAARQLELALRNDPTHAAFATVILQTQAVPVQPVHYEPVRQPATPGAPQRSLDNMLAQTAQTQAFLTPSLWPAIRRTLKRGGRRGFVLFRAFVLRKPTRVSPVLEKKNDDLDGPVQPRGSNVVTPRSRAVQLLPKGTLQKIPSFLWQRGQAVLKATPAIVERLRTATQRLRQAPRALPAIVEERVQNVRGLPQRNRLYFYGAAGLAVLFAITLIGVGIQRNHSATTKTRAAAITTIEEKVDQAASSVIYGDEDRARTLLQEAQTAISALPDKSKNDKATRSRLIGSVEAAQAQIRHIVTTAPSPLVSLAAEAQPVGLVLLGSALYTVDTKTNALLNISTNDKKVTIATTLPGDPGVQALATYGSGTLMALAANLDIIEQRPAAKTGTRSALATPSSNPNLVGLTTYNSAVYVADVANSALLRATKRGAVFQAAAWLKQSATLSNAVDLVVDGSIYVVASDGTVQKFTQGRRDQFVLSPVDPALSSATKIAGDVNLQNLYILDTASKRIAVFTKTGKFVNQYVHDSLQNVSAFTVDERTQKIYLLIGNEAHVLAIQKTK